MSYEAFIGAEEHKRKKRLSDIEFKAYKERRHEKIPTIHELHTESEHMHDIASIGLLLELEPTLKNTIQDTVSDIIMNSPNWEHLTQAQQNVINKKSFTVQIEASQNSHDALTVIPEGVVAEKIPLNPQLAKQVLASLKRIT